MLVDEVDHHLGRAVPWLHPVKIWSLREVRGGSDDDLEPLVGVDAHAGIVDEDGNVEFSDETEIDFGG